MQNERRRHRRYRVKDNAFTVINPDPVKVVPIIDIGMGGLGIYLDEGTRWLEKSSQLEIMLADCSFYLEKVPFRIVSQTRAFPDNDSNLMEGGRYSIKFGALSPGQKSQLKYFIRHHTEKGVVSKALHWFSKFLDPIRTPKFSNQSCDTSVWQSMPRSSF